MMKVKRLKISRDELVEKITSEYISALKDVLKLPKTTKWVAYVWDSNKRKHIEFPVSKGRVLCSFFMYRPALVKSSLEGNPYIITQ